MLRIIETSRQPRYCLVPVLAALYLASAASAQAEIVRFEAKETVPAYGGETFGTVGAYEMVRGIAYGELDPSHDDNAGIVDIDLAPKNDKGMVEYSTQVEILRPVDPALGNDRMFFEVLNRGNKLATEVFDASENQNELTEADSAGNGYLLRQGYSVVWAGWQSDKNVSSGDNHMMAFLPEPVESDGSPITGQTNMPQIFNDMEKDTISLLYDVADPSAGDAKLLVYNKSGEDAVEVPSDAWSFTDARTVKINRQHEFLKDYDAGAQYNIVYTAKNPDVSGIGLAIVRDLVSFLRHDETDQNPLAGNIRYALAYGSSQSGRMLKEFLHEGFNRDEAGRMVFEGLHINISGAHTMALNERFGDANLTGRAYERYGMAAIWFPFTYGTMTDPLTGETDGLLSACTETATCPKIVHTDSGNEAWGKAASLVTTDGEGHDIALPENVRVYYMAGAQHGPATKPLSKGYCQQLRNPNNWHPINKALFEALDLWATAGYAPPASAYPRVADGTLAPPLPQDAIGFPEIPGVTYNGMINSIGVPDKSSYPYAYGKERYVVLAPRTDTDGNDIAGVRTVELQVPTGTYTGWALRREGFAQDEECQLNGQYIPFANTSAEREERGDPAPVLRGALRFRWCVHPGRFRCSIRARRSALAAERRRRCRSRQRDGRHLSVTPRSGSNHAACPSPDPLLARLPHPARTSACR